jgi:hypothetical protein
VSREAAESVERSIPREVKVPEGSEAEEAAERTGKKNCNGPKAKKLPPSGANQRRQGSLKVDRAGELAGRS